jgi:membrane protein DedA with SNARE-associated domain
MSHIIPFFQLHPYSSLFVMILVEELGVFLPFPGDAALLLFGVWSRQGRVDFVTTLVMVCVATLVGATILYAASRWVGRLLLEKYTRILRFFHITQDNIDLIERWMAKYGWAALIIARVVPGLRIVGTVAAGVLGVPYRVFLPATMVGTVLWTVIYYSLGSILGRRYAGNIDLLLSNRNFLPEAMLVALLIWFLMAKFGIPAVKKRFFGQRRNRQKDPEILPRQPDD